MYNLITTALTNPTGTIIKLDPKRTKQTLTEEVGQILYKITGYDPEWIVKTMTNDSRGVFFQKNKEYNPLDTIKMCPEYKEKILEGLELRFRVKLCNFQHEILIPKIYVNKYLYTFIGRKGYDTKIGKELRLFIYPAFKEIEEGE